MSDPHTAAGTEAGAADPMKYSKEIDNPATLVIVFAIVLGLTFASVGLSSLGLGKLGLPVQLTIGTIQAALVGYHFMHLKQGDKVVTLTALASIFWMGILFTLFMSDYMTRRIIVGW